jgi:hypothetical protein
MFENQHIKMENAMYAPKRLESCHGLTDMFQNCSKLPCRKIRCSAENEDVLCSTVKLVIIEQTLLNHTFK